ncbi:MAG: hypothetical protein B7Z54_01500 [Sphingobacteriales bacterium 12-47-4]|nr:MAG: hypothetical protein B7Z54_01500 [Sphingobacteriales bacterium 12-47-4]
MRTSIKQRFLSIWARISSILLRKGKQKSKASTPPTVLYHTTDKTPVSVFRECLIGGNLTALIISGNPTPGELAEAWANLFGQYFDLIKSGRSRYIQTLQKNIFIRDVENRVIENSCIVTMETVNQLYEVLKEMGAQPQEKVFADFRAMLEREQNKLALNKLKLTQEIEEYDGLTKDEGQGKIEENYFDKMIIRLFEKYGFFDERSITVSQMCAMMSVYISDAKIKDNAGSKHDKRTV